ncbi:hypothetical protein E1B28_003234 [Marasmius oreades]|uniref:SMODS and SLOG-associating 2TM effector domain-containing protein n=1 Tax=Marasmius oreades TaxID=181124 RepID=A0A9P7RLD0_9AGAR|nr:uncharacterized protein E1B28_003234 [Marasmius oreades]KAG7085689.1 hypothetical protein E1B28_003234 [Marasmius oreades]
MSHTGDTNAPGPSSGNPQAPGSSSAPAAPPSSPNPSPSRPIRQASLVTSTSDPSSRPISQAFTIPLTPTPAPPVRAILSDEKTHSSPTILPAHPIRAISCDEKVHADNGELGGRNSTLDLRRKAAPLPPVPSRGSPVLHGSPTDEYRSSGQADLGRMNTVNSRGGSNIDWIVPQAKDVAFRPKTVGERLDPTLTNAIDAKNRYSTKARMTGLALNIAIGLQVLLGALTTGLSAVTSGHQTSVAVSVLGGLSTLVASFLARSRGSNEPELSITRVKDLEQFIRECEAFKLDFGHESGHEHDPTLLGLRERFEELLGNANGERKLSPV